MNCLFTGSLSYKFNQRVHKFYSYHIFLFMWRRMGYRYHSTLWHLRWHRCMNTLLRHSNTRYRSVLCTIITLSYRLYSYWLLEKILINSTLYWNVIDFCFGQAWGLSLFSSVPWKKLQGYYPDSATSTSFQVLEKFFFNIH